ncbi:MAG: hypothetical protein K1000chlam2_01485 [Chlamydiae bacterium]|nr:hypothetical protein [Chlamydiota bacterium]
MSVQNINTTPQIHQMMEHDTSLSKKDWKTHSLVVLSYLLVGIGIVLACAFPYIALMTNHTVAILIPAVVIASGVLGGIQAMHFGTPDRTVEAPAGSPKCPFIGLHRKGQNCWLNAALQLVFNTPAFKKRLEQRSFWKGGLNDVMSAFRQYKKETTNVSSVDTQAIRKWLSTKVSSLDPSPKIQEEPWQFLSYFLDQITSQLPKQTVKTVSQVENKASTVQSTNEPLTFFELGVYYHEAKSLHEAFDLYFNESLNPRDKSLRFYTASPEDFSIRFLPKDSSGKVKKNYRMPMQWETTERHFGGKSQYVCDAFLYHDGNSSEYGHWVACLYDKGHWWKISDAIRTLIPKQQAQAYLDDSAWVHYQKS